LDPINLPYLTRNQVRRIDAQMVARYGIPSVLLMENAGRSASDIILKMRLNNPRFR